MGKYEATLTEIRRALDEVTQRAIREKRNELGPPLQDEFFERHK
jgi:hypothetical protein